jgi:hypothetical protein
MKKFNIREFVQQVLEIDSKITSKQMSEFLKEKGHDFSWQTIAAIRGQLNKL